MAKKVKKNASDYDYLKALLEPDRFDIPRFEVYKRRKRLMLALDHNRTFTDEERSTIKHNIILYWDMAKDSL